MQQTIKKLNIKENKLNIKGKLNQINEKLNEYTQNNKSLRFFLGSVKFTC